LGGRRAAAGALSVLVVLSLAVPLFGALIMLALQARDLLLSALHGLAARGALPGVLRTGHTGVEETGLGAVAQEVPSVGALVRDPASVVDWLREHGATLWQVVAGVAGASANAALGAIVFIVALYTFAVHGRRVYAWFVWRSPLGARATRRLVGAFRETGRGLIVGTGGTALAQGALGAITYAALGVPNAIALGALTAMGAFVPAIGTALVWGPVAVGLALAGRPVSAAILAAVGVGIIGTIDNVLRPLLARAGRLRLPAVVLFFAVLGGLDLAGGWGVVLGPLLVRLAVEGLAILRGSTPASSPSHWQGQQP
ncbi:MAG TPA: AI-2E family transporter, partial [Polyangiaceae bacterium]|nr:AI-2E family transporter [Polyangiaceae bacterium]